MRNSNRRPAFLILFATLMASAGTGISIVTFPWLVLQRSGSAGQASIVAGATTMPLMFSTLLAGTAVDYFGRRRVSLIADAFSGTAVATAPLAAWMFGDDAINVGMLAVLGACSAAFDPAGMTARESMLPEAAAQAGWPLDRTTSIYQAFLNVAFIVGPGIGGLMIATIGGIHTMWITAGVFGLSFLGIAALRLEGTGKPSHPTQSKGLMSEVFEGLRFVWSLRVLRTLALIDLTVTALYLPMESVLFPKYFTDHQQPRQLGWTLMALSLGGLIGTLGYAALAKYLRRRTTVLVATFTLGMATAAIAFLPPLPVILGLCALIGLVYGPIQPIYNYVSLTRSPTQLRGRVLGVMISLAFAAGPLGLLLAGPLTDAAGLKATFGALALPILLTGLICVRLPSLHEIDREPQAATELGP